MWDKEKNLRYYIRNSELAILCGAYTRGGHGVLFLDRFNDIATKICTDEIKAKKLHKISSKYAEKRKNLLDNIDV